MRKEIVLSLCLVLFLPATGQVAFDCDPVMIQRLDSVVNYVRDGQTDIFTPVDVFIYEFDGVEHYPVIEKLSLPTRIPVNKQNYFYDDSGKKTYYVLQYWNGVQYLDNVRTDYYYNGQGYLEREVFSGMSEGIWVPYQQHWYNYDESNITQTYLRQMVNAGGEWYDFSYKNYLYNEAGQLTERNERRIADGVIFWADLFTYDALGRTSVRVRQSLKYSPETGTYILTNLNRQTYLYDIYGELSEYSVETWLNNTWTITGKSVYYYSIIKGNHIAVCHKGQTIYLPAKQVDKHLAHGDLLGPCECLTDGKTADLKAGSAERTEITIAGKDLVIYPNPASTEITVYLPELPSSNSRLAIYSSEGALILSMKPDARTETINIGQLLPGAYYLSVNDDTGTYTKIIIKD